MGLLEMGYSDPTADLHVEGVCVDFDRFLADLESVAGTTDDKCEEFPTEAYHAHIFGMQNRGTTLLDFIVNYLYRFVLIVTPFIYTTIMCYKLVSRYEEKGGMAYLLNSHYSRKQVIVTQGINLLLGISVMIVFVTALTILSCAFMFQGELDITGFLTLNLGLLILQIFLATFCFMFTCAFSEIKYSVGIGAGIGSLFIMIQMVSQVFDNELLKYCNPLSLFNPDQIIEYNPISLLCIGILFVVSILFFIVAVKSFKRKDLML